MWWDVFQTHIYILIYFFRISLCISLGGPFHPRERNALHWEKIYRVVRINSFENSLLS